jgi:hypothetical protein
MKNIIESLLAAFVGWGDTIPPGQGLQAIPGTAPHESRASQLSPLGMTVMVASGAFTRVS